MSIIKQSFWAALAAFAIGASVFAGCNDNASKVGFTTQPKDEALTAKADTFLLSAQTVEVPSIYSRSTYTLLGQLSDPLFGDLRSSYITRLRHAPGFKFAIALCGQRPLFMRLQSPSRIVTTPETFNPISKGLNVWVVAATRQEIR